MHRAWLIGLCLAATLVSFGSAQEDLTPSSRHELKRASVSGTNMEVIVSVMEIKPGEVIPRHIHHGEEAIFALQSATFETPDGKQTRIPTGTVIITARDVPHGLGAKVVSSKPFKYLAVHIVDKGAPLYDAPQN